MGLTIGNKKAQPRLSFFALFIDVAICKVLMATAQVRGTGTELFATVTIAKAMRRSDSLS